MKQFIIRADDVGYSEAVNLGIARTVREGLVGSVGLMPNMPLAAQGLEMLKGTGVCIGQHTNLCLGRPCADPAKIPSLLDENGNLKSSRAYRDAWARGEELIKLDEAVVEIEAQYFRFQGLVGRAPDYFEAHAVLSKNLFRGLEIVAARYGLRYSAVTPADAVGTFAGNPIALCAMQSMKPDYDAYQSLRDAVGTAREDMPNVYVCHPGYVDAYLLRHSSLTVNRAYETEMLCDSVMRRWLDEQGVQRITYNDITDKITGGKQE